MTLVSALLFVRSDFVRSHLAVEILSVCLSVCLSHACIVTKRKHLAKKVQLWLIGKSPTSFPVSRRWTAYVAPKPPNSVTVHFIRQMARFTYLWSNAHTTITCLLSDCLSHYGDVRCALAVHGSGPTCQYNVDYCCSLLSSVCSQLMASVSTRRRRPTCLFSQAFWAQNRSDPISATTLLSALTIPPLSY